MSSIAATSPVVIPQRSPATQAAAGALAAAGTTASATAPAPPDAVVISVGQSAPSAAAGAAGSAAERRVDSLVEKLRSHNDRADAWAHFSWTTYAQDVGETKAAAVRAEVEKYTAYSAARIGREFGESGIDVRPATDRQMAETGAAPGTLLARSFAFKEGGATYAVTAREDGTLVGTRDGQAWKSWKTVPSNTWKGTPPYAASTDKAAAALATLQGLLSPARAGGATVLPGLLRLSA